MSAGGYKCDDCGGELIYHEQDLDHGEHHECPDCGKIYPYEGHVHNPNRYDKLKGDIGKFFDKTGDYISDMNGLVQLAHAMICEHCPAEVQWEWVKAMTEFWWKHSKPGDVDNVDDALQSLMDEDGKSR